MDSRRATPEGFPRQHARTRRFRLGVPSDFTIAPDGGRVVFRRTRRGDDPMACLWALDLVDGRERVVADPRELAEDDEDELPPEERSRRERRREQTVGVVAYATDRAVGHAAFSVTGRLFWVVLETGASRRLDVPGPVVDPRPNPQGTAVAYVSAGALRVAGADGVGVQTLASPDAPGVTYGLPEYVAAESMGRLRGYWWAPDGTGVLVARVDTSGVPRRYIADPANPDRPPMELAYPAAGTTNADVSLWLVGLDGSRVAVDWDRIAFEYVVTAAWDERALLVVVQSRDQRATRVLEVDPATGATSVLREDTEPHWVEIVAGVPAHIGSGALVWTIDDGETRRLLVDDRPVTPPGLQVRAVLDTDGDNVLFAGGEQPTEIHLWRYSPATGPVRITHGRGVYEGRLAGGTLVVAARSLDHDGVRVGVWREGAREGGQVASIASCAETPVLTPRPELLRVGERQLATAVLLPSWHRPGEAKLPVLLDPYAGPGGQRVLCARDAYLVSQWFAEQGFAVVIADGRGTPGRGPVWERTVRGDIAEPVLDDQVEALGLSARRYPDLDLTRVAIRGWSFGGYLAALAVLRRPDVFHAAVAGAPVTDQRLYDTHWKERYLGHPDEEPENYDRCSLLADAHRLRRPLMLIHGLADDNVAAAHTLRLSSALLAAGRPHEVLPLSGVTHMTPQEVVAENLLLLQADFLSRALDGRRAAER